MWLGVIILAYKTDPLRILLIKNKQTGNITPIAGALEKGENLKDAAVRELREEVGWTVDPNQFKKTDIKHVFSYGSQKKDRAGDKGENAVLLLNADDLSEAKETKDAKSARWLTPGEALKRISFEDLKNVITKSIEYI